MHATAAKRLHHIHHTQEQRRREEATTDGHDQVVLSLLCLWPYGNSLIVSSHSEFYQCHTQNRSHYHATSEASRSVHERRSRRQSRATQTRLPTLVRQLKTTEFRQERYMGRKSPEKWEERRSFRLPCGWTRALSNRSIKRATKFKSDQSEERQKKTPSFSGLLLVILTLSLQLQQQAGNVTLIPF